MGIATELAMKYFAVVNFVFLLFEEYYIALAKVRMERSRELLAESKVVFLQLC